MPPWREWYVGRAAIHRFFAWMWRYFLPEAAPFRLIPTAANCQPALAMYARHPGETAWRPHAIQLLTIEDGAIVALTTFRDPRLFGPFGLPSELDPDDSLKDGDRRGPGHYSRKHQLV